jgi:hypothetical protein
VLHYLNVTPRMCMGERSYGFTLLNLGIRWRWVVSFTPLPRYHRYRLYKRLGGSQSRPERYGEEKNRLPLYGNWTAIPPARTLVAVATELSRILLRLYSSHKWLRSCQSSEVQSLVTWCETGFLPILFHFPLLIIIPLFLHIHFPAAPWGVQQTWSHPRSFSRGYRLWPDLGWLQSMGISFC